MNDVRQSISPVFDHAKPYRATKIPQKLISADKPELTYCTDQLFRLCRDLWISSSGVARSSDTDSLHTLVYFNASTTGDAAAGSSVTGDAATGSSVTGDAAAGSSVTARLLHGLAPQQRIITSSGNQAGIWLLQLRAIIRQCLRHN